MNSLNYYIEDLQQSILNLQPKDKLNPKIWNKNKLLPEVEAGIHQIVDKFIKLTRKYNVDLKIVDIRLVGSNANYNYNDDSDLDVHIIADESFDCDQKHLETIYNILRVIFDNKYDIKLNDVPIEIYVENEAGDTVTSGGIFSLSSGWIKRPSISDIPELDVDEFSRLFTEYEDRYKKIIAEPQVNEIETFIDDLHSLRKKSIKEGGEFSTGNLVFKEFRRLGYIESLKDLKDELENIQMAIS